MQTNIVFKSNLYVLTEGILASSDYSDDLEELKNIGKVLCPYDDTGFVKNVFDPEKLKKIKEKTSIRYFDQMQEKIIQSSAICSIYQKQMKTKQTYLPQYWVFRPEKGNLRWKNICKCPYYECHFFEECRPREKEKAISECKKRDNLKVANAPKVSEGYPIILNINRILERYATKAYALIANENLQQRYEKENSRFTYLYNGDGNASSFENFDAGTDDRNFTSSSSKIEKVISSKISNTVSKNPMLEMQKLSNKNKNNPFFKQFNKD